MKCLFEVCPAYLTIINGIKEKSSVIHTSAMKMRPDFFLLFIDGIGGIVNIKCTKWVLSSH